MCQLPESKVYFKYDSANLSAEAKERLDQIANCATNGAATGQELLIVGRTDPVGTDEYNQQLGMSRAAARPGDREAGGRPHGAGDERDVRECLREVAEVLAGVYGRCTDRAPRGPQVGVASWAQPSAERAPPVRRGGETHGNTTQGGNDDISRHATLRENMKEVIAARLALLDDESA